MSLLMELDAFITEHRWCGNLEAGLDGLVVWIQCGARIARRVSAEDTPPYQNRSAHLHVGRRS
jgi:hypothetical protein